MVHPIVHNVVGAYLDLVDAEAPGLVEALYLVGSVALEDFRPKTSDIDFIAVTAKPLTEADLAALERTHSQLATRLRRPFFDGAGCHEGRVHRRAAGGCDPVAWHTLAQHGMVMRGPRREQVRVRTDQEGCEPGPEKTWMTTGRFSCGAVPAWPPSRGWDAWSPGARHGECWA